MTPSRRKPFPALYWTIIAVLLSAVSAQAQTTTAKTKKYVCAPCGSDCHDFLYDAPGECSRCRMPLVEAGEVMNVAILLFDGVELLDFAGPGEVFSVAECPGITFKVFTVAAEDKPITSQGFVKITPQYSLAHCPQPDILIIPGGQTRDVANDANVIQWIKRTYNHTKYILTVCTGAFVLAKTGLLDGNDVTTWHGAVDALRTAAPKATVYGDRRFVDNGDIITSAGVSAGIDASLHIIAGLQGNGIALRVAHAIEYPWKPYRYSRISSPSASATRTMTDPIKERLDLVEKDLKDGRLNAESALADPQLLDFHQNERFKELLRLNARESTAVLTTPDEPGDPLIVSGTVRDDKNHPVAGAIIHVFQADAAGAYTPQRDMDEPHARLFAYLKTGADGRFEFRTVRPGGYAGEYRPEPGVALKIPEHIHFDVTAPGCVDRKFQMVFRNDPRMTPHWREWARKENNPIVDAANDPALRVRRCVCDVILHRS